MDANIVGLLAAALTAVGGLYLSLRRLPIEKRSAEATSAAQIAKAASELVDDLQQEIARLRGKIEKLEYSDRENKKQLEILRHDLINAQASIRELEARNAALAQENKRLIKIYKAAYQASN